MEGIVAGAAANLTSDSAKGILQELIRHVKYVINYKKNVDKFDKKTQYLKAKRKSVQKEVDVAERNLGKINPDVELWCKAVDKAMDEALKEVIDLQDKAKSKCFIGLCPNIKSRYQLSRKAEDDSIAFDELLQQCQYFNEVAIRDVPEAMVDAPPKDFEAFESRRKVFDNIMEALKDSIDMIGVYGKAGVGKTTLVNEVGRQLQKNKIFHWVVKATVTRSPHIEKIQDQIAETLGLNLQEKSINTRARRLCQRLKQEKTVLVILDDVWKRLELEEVGILYGDEHKGCKILMTSRDHDVLSNATDSEKSFELGVLEDFDAWNCSRRRLETLLKARSCGL
ncbi:hypothetical protein PTKIN_Ptkin06aG0198400 [Pterospermum kingtungense]